MYYGLVAQGSLFSILIYRTLKKNLGIVLLQLPVYRQKSVKFLALSSLNF